ncbi:MAG: hypothetical protein DRJ09_03630 [Bacteroidetes bacterium]|nr:MAG: hypothetical protein DRJ09_03630 [Bacteroidota bacterium]
MKKRLLFLAASFLMLHVAFAQFNFNDKHFYSPYRFEYNTLLFGDINGDHCSDLLAYTHYIDKQINLYIIDNNQLGSASCIGNNFDYYNLSIVDMNNDGFNDIVAERNTSSGNSKVKNIVILQNDGTGRFTESIIYSAALLNAINFTVGDLNSDNLKDFVLTQQDSNRSNSLIWLKNKGGYDFDKIELLTQSVGSEPIIVDFNGDGQEDIVMNSSKPVWYENKGLEKFVLHNLDIYLNENNFNYLADLDKDGLTDIFSLKDGYIMVYKNLGNDTFANGSPLFMLKKCSSYSLNDVDGDGYLDVVFNEEETDRLYWVKNDETGGFYTFSEFDVEKSRYHYLTDMNGDGYKDVVTPFTDYRTPLATVFINDGQGNFTKDQINYTQEAGNFIPVKDKNHSLNDVLFKAFYRSNDGVYGKAVYLLKNKGGSEFDFPEAVIEKWVDFFKTADMDNNGDPDIFYVDEENNMFWAENDGTNHFSVNHPIITDFLAGSDVILKDVDGDSLPDMVGVSHNSSTGNGLYVIKNNDGNFDSTQLITPELHGHVTVADINNDGINEIICQTENKNLSLFYHDGNLMKEKIISTGYNFTVSAVHDLDGDGKQDIFVIISNFFTHSVGWFRNLGNFTFDAILMIQDSTDISLGSSIGFFDWNNDGLSDIECFPSDNYFVNKGEGNFELSNKWIGIEIPGVERLVDMDGDGDLDVLDRIFDLEFCVNTYNNKTERNITICRGDSVKNFNRWLKTTGDYYDTIPTALGGDNISCLHLTVADNANSELLITGNQRVNEMNVSEYFIREDHNLSYFWDVNNGIIVSDSGQNRVKIAWQQPGAGYVTATIYDPVTTCFTLSNLSVTVNKVSDDEIAIYPNPTSDKLFITKTFEGSITEIYNQMGALVLQSDKSEIDISMLPAGTYPVLIKSKTNEIRTKEKLVVY